jgi:hypothetical protein
MDQPKPWRQRLTVPITPITVLGVVVGVFGGASLAAFLQIGLGLDDLDYNGRGRGSRLISLFRQPEHLLPFGVLIGFALICVYGSKWLSNKRYGRQE